MAGKKKITIPKAPVRGNPRKKYLERYIAELQEEIKTSDEETKKELRAEIAKARAELRSL